MRLGGAAGEFVRSITPDEILNGGVINGVQVDPIIYIVAGLQQRFAMLVIEHGKYLPEPCHDVRDAVDLRSVDLATVSGSHLE